MNEEIQNMNIVVDPNNITTEDSRSTLSSASVSGNNNSDVIDKYHIANVVVSAEPTNSIRKPSKSRQTPKPDDLTRLHSISGTLVCNISVDECRKFLSQNKKRW